MGLRDWWNKQDEDSHLIVKVFAGVVLVAIIISAAQCALR